MTERVAAALREQFVIRRRGTVTVKGKGPMQTFLLTGQRSRDGASAFRHLDRADNTEMR